MKDFNEIFKSPLDAIKRAKREKNLNKTVEILIATWIFISLSFLLTSLRAFPSWVSVALAVFIFLLGIICQIIFGYLVKIIMNILGGRGKYFEGITAITYSLVPMSVGLLATAILAFIHPAIGAILGFIIIAVTTAMSFSIYFRSIKELFNTDILTTFIGFLIIIYVVFVSIYATAIVTATGNLPLVRSLLTT